MAGFPLQTKPIQATDTLNTGWRVITNFNVGKIITNVFIDENLDMHFITSDGSEGVVPLSDYLYSKDQIQNLDVPFATESVAGKIRVASPEEAIEGLTNSSAMTPGMVSQYFEYILSRDFVATEAMSAGTMVNVFKDGTTQKVRKADSTDTTRFCSGFIKEDTGIGDEIAVYVWGIVSAYSGLEPGLPYYLSAQTPGAIQKADPNANFTQQIGVALSENTIFFFPSPPRPKQEERYKWFAMDGNLVNGEWIPVYEYQIGSLVAGAEIISITLQQPATDKTLKPIYYDYFPEEGKIVFKPSLAPLMGKGEGFDFMIERSTFGTAGFGYGTDVIVDGNQIKYKFGNATEYKVAGSIPVNAGTHKDISIPIYEAGTTWESNPINLNGLRLVSWTLYDQNNSPIETAAVRFLAQTKTFDFNLQQDLTNATLTYRTEPL